MHIRRLLRVSSLAAAVVFVMHAQEKPPQSGQRMMMRFDAESSVMLREVMTIVSEEKGKLTIMMVPPASRRPEGLPSVDLQKGDEVGMAAGKRVATIEELRKAYESAKPGEEFKLGVRREGRPIVVTFTRRAEKDLPGGGPMVLRRGSGDENSDMFPALGLGLEKKGDVVVVAEMLPHASKEIRKGDVVSSLNGVAVKNVTDFAKTLDATKVGDKLNFELQRNGQQVTVSFARPEPKGMLRMEQ